MDMDVNEREMHFLFYGNFEGRDRSNFYTTFYSTEEM